MKVFLSRLATEHSPSQGRNPGSIPGGSTMVAGAKYWAQSDDTGGDVFEIMHYVGRKVTQPGYVFEDGHGDIHILSDHEVVVAPEGLFDEHA